MSETEELTPLERAVLKEINEIDKKISALQEEKRILNRTLFRSKVSKVSASIPRKNSIERVYIEGKILELLKSSKGGIGWGGIYKEMLWEKADLKETTLRTYLFRLKERGLISYDYGVKRYSFSHDPK